MKRELNLLPIHSSPKKTRSFSGRNPWIGAVLGSLVLLSMIHGVLTMMNQLCLSEIEKTEEIIENNKKNQIIYESIGDQNRLLDYRNKLEEGLTQNKDTSLKALTGIYTGIPLGIKLTECSFIGGELTVTGAAKNQEDILQYREQLMTQAFFKNVNIRQAVKKSLMENENKDSGKQVKDKSIWEFTFEIQTNGVDKI